jgi:hypothetical protein
LSSPEPDDVLFRAHLARYAPAAVGQALEAAAEVATSRDEFLAFAVWRFHDLIHLFSASFDDSCLDIGEPFVRAASAAQRAMKRQPDDERASPYEGAR